MNLFFKVSRILISTRGFASSNGNLSSIDPYKVFGLSSQSSFTEVKQKYFQLAKKYHPDVNPNNDVQLSSYVINYFY